MKQLGGSITSTLKAKYAKSENWKNGKFENLEETSMELSIQTLPKMLYKQFCEKEGREPVAPLPVVPFDKSAFMAPSDSTKYIWYGHSVILFRMKEKTLLIDPMLGSNASPIAPFATNRFSQNTLGLIDEFPDIDLVLLTHDHYDHIDLVSIEKLVPKVKHFFVAMGVGRHLEKWGIEAEKITEFDWWDAHPFEDIDITFTPSRHFSGRGLTDRAKSLWGGWVFKTDTENLWFSGDGGYGDHFKQVGEKLGPFDFAFMECGQYNENWHQIHMYPEESIQAALDAGVKLAQAVHWGAFALAQHHWKDPIQRFSHHAAATGQPISHPPIGHLQFIAEACEDKWWESYE